MGSVNLPILVISRIATTAIFMTYPACLSVLVEMWRMSATQAGIVQGAFTAAFAVSLFLSSNLCDRVGARTVFRASVFLSAATAILFATFARSFESAAVLIALMGLAQGGTYTPAIMIVSANVPAARKASSVGWVLAGMSGGYVLSIFLGTALAARFGYETAFWVAAATTIPGWALGHVAVSRAKPPVEDANPADAAFDVMRSRRSRLLTIGYIGHCWELMGAWAWVPAFLSIAILSAGQMSAFELGLWTALALHLSGFFSSFLSGYAADRFGARRVLVGFAILGGIGSLTIGWFPDVHPALLLLMAAVYGFATIGDSAVLSSAMTDAVPARQLGRVLGVRSVLGIGAGAIAPVAFGATLDVMPGGIAWGLAFSMLAAGAAIAALCALRLPR